MKRPWHELTPEQARGLVLPHPEIQGPLDSEGEECPWPWEPMTLTGAAFGMYHCNYCGEMVLAGVPHTDYRDVDYSAVTEP